MRSAWTQVGGLWVHARVAVDAAPAEAGDVVLVHGVGVSSRYMVPLALELACDFRVHAPDLPGFGLSEHPAQALDLVGLADALVAWVQASGLERPALVANSMGCQVAVEALARRAQPFVRAVLQGPTFDRCGRSPLVQGMRWLRTGVHEPLELNAILARDYLACGPLRALATARHALADPLEDKLGGIGVPVLVVRGGADAVVPHRWAEEVAGALPDGRLAVLPGTAHALNFSAAAELAGVVRPFLGASARPRRASSARRAEDSIADFDSATAMLRASARALEGRSMAGLGAVPRPLAPVAERLVPSVNALPARVREALYRRASGSEGLPPAELHTVSGEAVARWMVDRYPRRTYPAAIVGSSSGAISHLAAALGIPFLPQTFLIPVAQPEVHPDEPRDGLVAGRGPGQLLLDANPELQLHHMHDPNQDRLTLARMAYFRVKRRQLGDAFARFLTESLPRGATLFVADCRLRWPVTRVGERHLFQFGALGGMDAQEFHQGSSRVEDYLRRYDAQRQRWDPPAPDEEAPEAEWGLEPALLEDLEQLAGRRGLRLRRIVFDDPEDLSPLVADLHRWWYRRHGLPAQRLLVESFALLDPWWAIRTASVPLWLKFAVDPSAERLERYLDTSEPYDELHLTLFPHGTSGVGVPPMERWQQQLLRARDDGRYLAVDPQRFPSDFAAFGRFERELRALDARHKPPPTLTLAELDEFLAARTSDHGVAWPDG